MAISQLVPIQNRKVRHPHIILAGEEEKCQLLYKNKENNFYSVAHDVILKFEGGL
jgi:hypothetical protein